MYSFHKSESRRVKTGSRRTARKSLAQASSGGCGSPRAVRAVPRTALLLRFRGAGSCTSPSACMRRQATRQLISLSPPSGLRQSNSAHTRSERTRRFIPGSAASARIRASSSSLKSRPQYLIAGLPVSPVFTSCPGSSPGSAQERFRPIRPSAHARAR